MPYLGVERSYAPGEIAGQTVILQDYRGLKAREAEKQIKAQGLSCRILGQGEHITRQIPEPGQKLPGGGQVLLYLDTGPESREIAAPNLLGKTRQQCILEAGTAGLSVVPDGNPDYQGIAISQEPAPGERVLLGGSLYIRFADQSAGD